MDLVSFTFEPQVALTLSRQEHHLQEIPNFPGEGMAFDTDPVGDRGNPACGY